MNRWGRMLGTAVGVLTAMLVTAGCGDGGSGSKAGTSFAASIADTDAFVGAVVNSDDRQVLAYVCDGRTVGTWFRGRLGVDGGLELTSDDGARLVGRVQDDKLTTAVTLPGGAPTSSWRPRSPRPLASTGRADRWAGSRRWVAGWCWGTAASAEGSARPPASPAWMTTSPAPASPVGFSHTGSDF